MGISSPIYDLPLFILLVSSNELKLDFKIVSLPHSEIIYSKYNFKCSFF